MCTGSRQLGDPAAAQRGPYQATGTGTWLDSALCLAPGTGLQIYGHVAGLQRNWLVPGSAVEDVGRTRKLAFSVAAAGRFEHTGVNLVLDLCLLADMRRRNRHVSHFHEEEAGTGGAIVPNFTRLAAVHLRDFQAPEALELGRGLPDL